MSDDHKADVERYIAGVSDGTIVTGRLNRLAVYRHQADLVNAEARGFYFDEQIATDAIEFSLCCNQFEGEWAGKPLELRLEQKFIVWCLFGWRQKSDGLRRFRQAQIECARKWGKSTMVAYLACLLLFADNPAEPGGQGYVAATKLSQAEIVWNAAASMINKSEELREECSVKPSKHEIKLLDLDSKFYPLAQDGDTVDGFNPHFIIKDEEHAYRKHMTAFINTLSSGFGSRRQPLTITITTYGNDKSDIWQSSHDYAVRCLESVIDGEIVDDTWFAFIAAVDRDANVPCYRCKGDKCPWCGGAGILPIDDPYDERCWIKANPGLGITPKLERMRETANEAKNRIDKESEFFQKNLNIVVSSREKLIRNEAWEACRGELSDWSTATRIHGATDMGRSNDMAGSAAVARFDMTDDSGKDFRRFEIRSRAWTCEDRHDDVRTNQIARWVADGLLSESSGDQILFSDVEDWVVEKYSEFGCSTWAYDPAFGPQLGQRLQEVHGLKVFPFSQNPFRYNAPTRMLASLLTEVHIVNGKQVRALCHDGDPVLAWMMTNLIVRKNAKDEWMPDKGSSPQKIDIAVAVLMALSECVYSDAVQPQGKFYEEHELEFV